MDIIHLLPDSVANQIAAGEVIQRPASCLKELVENSLDAGATRIQVIVRDAGRTLLQVIDDGIGMSEMDARLAFERHATSKIREAKDLFSLRTMGFRGEALASICAVSQVEMTTRRKEDETGTLLEIHGSDVVRQEPCSCPVGTNIKVSNLFFNVPVRRKFLKTDQTELRNLLNEFYSPLHNKRTDEYGGTLEGRLRIHREVLAAVRATVSDEFVVGMRLGGCDYEEGGATIEDAVEAARILTASGVDYLNLSGGWHAWRRAGHEEPGWFADQSRAVKAVVDTPILLAGGIQTPEQADVLLANGACDIVGIGRPLLKNPAWPED